MTIPNIPELKTNYSLSMLIDLWNVGVTERVRSCLRSDCTVIELATNVQFPGETEVEMAFPTDQNIFIGS
ncbi:hypothetical protein J6590_086564 [Homalodisca vitripennis]|nr:hypothetical protein J6590_086564 [Homalodisca vitripennis]